ncbi:Hypothetical protein PHPALM_16798 [Phytophthora palmivora]|uniref:Uncharacterized protein n=1 Tax=Phytophthora palmivora TaxID=4796 RepID=A0A2P4XP25_9STRA|nr:Hypothetical protein PHPALM_16798 [Phytophthora palmivora]
MDQTSAVRYESTYHDTGFLSRICVDKCICCRLQDATKVVFNGTPGAVEHNELKEDRDYDCDVMPEWIDNVWDPDIQRPRILVLYSLKTRKLECIRTRLVAYAHTGVVYVSPCTTGLSQPMDISYVIQNGIFTDAAQKRRPTSWEEVEEVTICHRFLKAGLIATGPRDMEAWQSHHDGLYRSKAARDCSSLHTKGNVLPEDITNKTSRLPIEAMDFVEEYIRVHPCFYVEELQEAMKERFGGALSNSTPTLCRLLKFDFKITRKILTKHAHESVPAELEDFYRKTS